MNRIILRSVLLILSVPVTVCMGVGTNSFLSVILADRNKPRIEGYVSGDPTLIYDIYSCANLVEGRWQFFAGDIYPNNNFSFTDRSDAQSKFFRIIEFSDNNKNQLPDGWEESTFGSLTDKSNFNYFATFCARQSYLPTLAKTTNIPPHEVTALFVDSETNEPIIPQTGQYANRGRDSRLLCETTAIQGNPDCWLQCDDIAAVSVCERDEKYTTKVATLISPRHVIMANHWSISTGSKITWVTPDNQVETAHIVRSKKVLGDIRIGILNRDILSIPVVKWLPTNCISDLAVPFRGVSTTRYLDVFPEQAWNLNKTSFRMGVYSSATDQESLNWSRYKGIDSNYTAWPGGTPQYYVQDGDSGNPNFLFDGVYLYLVGLNWSGGSRSVGGENLIRQEAPDVIEGAMRDLDELENRSPSYVLNVMTNLITSP